MMGVKSLFQGRYNHAYYNAAAEAMEEERTGTASRSRNCTASFFLGGGGGGGSSLLHSNNSSSISSGGEGSSSEEIVERDPHPSDESSLRLQRQSFRFPHHRLLNHNNNNKNKKTTTSSSSPPLLPPSPAERNVSRRRPRKETQVRLNHTNSDTTNRNNTNNSSSFPAVSSSSSGSSNSRSSQPPKTISESLRVLNVPNSNNSKPNSLDLSTRKSVETKASASINNKNSSNSSNHPNNNNNNNKNEKNATNISMSAGSTVDGDSFVLPLDWHYGTAEDDNGVALFHPNHMDRSLEDPYLLPHGPRPPPTTTPPRSKQPLEESSSPTLSNANKSFGTLDLPLNTSGILMDESNILFLSNSKPKPKAFDPPPDGVTCDGESSYDDNEPFYFQDCIYPKLTRLSPRQRALQMVDYYKVELGAHYTSVFNGNRYSSSSSSNSSSSSKSDHSCNDASISSQKSVNHRDVLLKSSTSVAGLWMELGSAQLMAEQYEPALQSYLQAAAIYRNFRKVVATAQALDRAGMAYCRALKQSGSKGGGLNTSTTTATTFQYLPAGMTASRALQCLREALTLRQQELGPWHVDTVDTLNHMANLYLLSGNPIQAVAVGEQVFYLRQAIFGLIHPAAAVVAHETANACLQAAQTEQASHWYAIARDIYQEMDLPMNNPAVQKLLQDIRRMERVERSTTTTALV